MVSAVEVHLMAVQQCICSVHCEVVILAALYYRYIISVAVKWHRFAKLVSTFPLAVCEHLGSNISVFIDVTRVLLAA